MHYSRPVHSVMSAKLIVISLLYILSLRHSQTLLLFHTMGVDLGGTDPQKWSGGDDNIDVSPEVSACDVHLCIHCIQVYCGIYRKISTTSRMILTRS